MRILLNTNDPKFFEKLAQAEAVATLRRHYNRLKAQLEDIYRKNLASVEETHQQGLQELQKLQRDNPEVQFEPKPRRKRVPKLSQAWTPERRQQQSELMRQRQANGRLGVKK